MATKYVNSNAGGANNGTSWTDAWADIASAVGVAAGDIVLVEYRSDNRPASSPSLNFSNGTRANPVKIISVDKDNSDAERAGAIIGTANSSTYTFTLTGHIFTRLMQLEAGFKISLTNGDNVFQRHESPTLKVATSASTGGAACLILGNTGVGYVGSRIELIDPTWIVASATFGGHTLAVEGAMDVLIRNLTYSGPAPTSSDCFLNPSVQYQNLTRFIVEDSDLSAFADLVDGSQLMNLLGTFRRCKLKSGYTLVANTKSYPLLNVLTEACAVGTITVPPLGLTGYDTYFGQITSDLSHYRAGGADDGTQANPHAWAMVSNANALPVYCPLVSPPITRWVAAGSQTVTVYVASGGTLNNDDFWIEVESPSEAGSATAQAKFNSTRCAPRATNAALTTDGMSTWNGSGVGTVQKVSVSIAPTVAGPVSVRCCFAKTSGTVYVDPKLGVA